jgi:8-oxo-dGTP pyrophosphatase MutT (NUDIX family)
MAKRRTIRIKTGKRLFNIRVAGLAFREGHVLVHRATHEKFWTFPGGTAEIGESSVDTLKREMLEEIGHQAEIGRLLWSVENFFGFEGRRWHEIGLYYLMDLPGIFPFASGEIVHRVHDTGNDLEFKWVEATQVTLEALPLQPDFIPQFIADLPVETRHLIHHESVPE